MSTVWWVATAIVVVILAQFPWSHPWLEGLLILILLGMLFGQWDTIVSNWKEAFA